MQASGTNPFPSGTYMEYRFLSISLNKNTITKWQEGVQLVMHLDLNEISKRVAFIMYLWCGWVGGKISAFIPALSHADLCICANRETHPRL